MASFKDSSGREWSLVIDPWGMKQVRDKTGVHLGRMLDDKFAKYAELMGDPIAFVDVLFALCAEQAAKAGVSDEQFGRSLGGDSLEKAAAAFEEAFADFCPSHLRKILKAMGAKVAAGQEKAATVAMAEIEKLDVFSLFATNSRASSESIPPG